MTNTTNQTKTIPSSFKINNKEYYSSEDLNTYDTAYFTGTHRNLRGIVKKKNIPESAITYAYVKDTKLIPSTETYVRAKLFLEAEWVKSNIPKMIQLKERPLEIKPVEVKPVEVKQLKEKPLEVKPVETKSVETIPVKVKPLEVKQFETKSVSKQKTQSLPTKVSNLTNKKLIPTKIFKSTIHTSDVIQIDNTNNDSEQNTPINIDELYDVPPAPELLYLSEDEMFKDSQNNVIEIEVRGEREHNKCFFKVKDIMKGFDMPSLEKNIKDKKSAYNYNEDFVFFTTLKENTDEENCRNSAVTKNFMFLTYNGILRCLFASHSKFVKKFINWASEILFIHQMGTTEQKQTLSSSLLGLNTQTIKDVFNTASNKTPTVYLFHLGSANQLLKTNTYSDDDILCKYGCTDDISRRTNEHERYYKKLYNIDISLLMYSIIDPKYIFDAESNIRGYFRSNKISSDDKTELIVINKNNLGQIKQHFKMMQNSYIGRYEEMNNKITELEKQLIIKDHQLELKDKDILFEKQKCELKDKDILYEKQKSEILEMKLMMLKFQTSSPTKLNFD